MRLLDRDPAPSWPRAGLPGGTVAFLMSDVAGSSRVWERDHERMDHAVHLLDALVNDAADACDGILTKPRGEGDGHFSVFRRASDAIAAAVDVQRSVGVAEWPDGFALRVRAAVHAPESDARDGDYYGVAVNRTARLRAAAHAGQVVVSAVAADLASGRLAGDRDAAQHRRAHAGRLGRRPRVPPGGRARPATCVSAARRRAGRSQGHGRRRVDGDGRRRPRRVRTATAPRTAPSPRSPGRRPADLTTRSDLRRPG